MKAIVTWHAMEGVTDRVGERNQWSARPEPGIPDLPLADWDALARVAAEGAALNKGSVL